MLTVLRLPRKKPLRQISPRSSPSFRGHLWRYTASATPATQIEPDMLKVLRLPRKKPRHQISPRSSPSFRGHLWRYCKCHASHSHAKSRGVKSVPVRRQASADIYGDTASATAATQIEPDHAESVTPATQKAAASNQSLFVAKLPRTSMEILQVPRLPHKSNLTR